MPDFLVVTEISYNTRVEKFDVIEDAVRYAKEEIEKLTNEQGKKIGKVYISKIKYYAEFPTID